MDFFCPPPQCCGFTLQPEKSIICPSLVLQVEKYWLKTLPEITP